MMTVRSRERTMATSPLRERRSVKVVGARDQCAYVPRRDRREPVASPWTRIRCYPLRRSHTHAGPEPNAVRVSRRRARSALADMDMQRRMPTILISILLLALTLPVAGRRADTLPATLTDREFWALSEQLSEPNGLFVSRSGSPDNLLSNEMQ